MGCKADIPVIFDRFIEAIAEKLSLLFFWGGGGERRGGDR